jgi:putative addiction module component (TIGR02574 family)
MATTIEKITREAAELSRQERLTLVRVLLDIDRPPKGGDVELAWDQEIRARIKAADEGRVTGIPYEQIKSELTRRFGAR